MDRVEEIEAAIDSLPPEESRRIAEWFWDREQRSWDEQLDRDSVSGKLDLLFQEGENESEKRLLRKGPRPK